MYLDSIISGYSWQQALKDGLLIPLSGPDYSGSFGDWIPRIDRAAGFELPLLMTRDAFDTCVMPLDDQWQLDPSQDAKMRLAKALDLAAKAVRSNTGKSIASFRIRIRANVRKGAIVPGRVRNLTLSIEAVERDDGRTCLVIMRARQR